MPGITILPDEEQRKVLEKSRAVDKRFHRWKVNWLEYKGENNLMGYYSEVRDFVMHMMYRAKKEQILARHRDRVDFCVNLYMYVNSIITFMPEKELLALEESPKAFVDPQPNPLAIKEL